MRTVLVIVLLGLLAFFYLGANANQSIHLNDVFPVKKYEPPPPPVKYETPEPRREEPQSYTVIITEEPEDAEVPPRGSSSIEQKIIETFPGEERIALAVAKAESSLNSKAVNRNRNGSKDIGVFQINDKHGWSAEERFDWEKNIEMAKELRDRYGWTEWSVYNNQQYMRFL